MKFLRDFVFVTTRYMGMFISLALLFMRIEYLEDDHHDSWEPVEWEPGEQEEQDQGVG